MENIITILEKLGIEVPEDKQDDLTKAVLENYVTLAEHQKKMGKITGERDKYKADYESAKETLDKFDGIDPEKINLELADWKKKAEDAETTYNEKIAERDYADAVNAYMSKLKFSSEAAKESVLNKIISKKLPLENGKVLGIDDYVKTLKDADKGAFVDDDVPSGARFTSASHGQGDPNAGVTKESIMAIKDATERQNMIAKHLDLFVKK